MTDDTLVSTGNEDGVEIESQQTPAVSDAPIAEETQTTQPAEPNGKDLDAVITFAQKAVAAKAKPADTPAQADPGKPAAQAVQKPELKPGQEWDPINNRVLEAVKAPVLPPLLKDKWSTVPREFQQYWADRERDMAVKIQQTADARKIADEYRNVVQPYEGLLKAGNTTAIAHTKELLQISHTLHTGSPDQKADLFFKLLQQFQPSAARLQQLIGGQAQPQHGALQPPQVQPSVDDLVSKRLSEQQEQQQLDAFNAELATFTSDPQNEFFDHVKDLMTAAISGGLVDGKDYKELLTNAYNLACAQHPEVKQVLAGRTQAKPKPQPTQSVRPSIGAGQRSQPVKAMDPDEAVKAAMRQHGMEI